MTRWNGNAASLDAGAETREAFAVWILAGATLSPAIIHVISGRTRRSRHRHFGTDEADDLLKEIPSVRNAVREARVGWKRHSQNVLQNVAYLIIACSLAAPTNTQIT